MLAFSLAICIKCPIWKHICMRKFDTIRIHCRRILFAFDYVNPCKSIYALIFLFPVDYGSFEGRDNDIKNRESRVSLIHASKDEIMTLWYTSNDEIMVFALQINCVSPLVNVVRVGRIGVKWRDKTCFYL